MDKTVVELFAGVGGFRVGLNNIKSIDEDGKAIENGNFTFVWENQWEPSTKTQHAYDCYRKRFGYGCRNQDISKVVKSGIPDHTLLVGGFPCQDYSVAHSLSKEMGIEGKKGVLWWQIRDILEAKHPKFVLLENVDRLLKSPAKQRGRDFGIMLRCMVDLGYTVEWRVINAADYGFPQRRRRVFIFASHKSTKYAQEINKLPVTTVLWSEGIFAKQFPVKTDYVHVRMVEFDKDVELADLSDNFTFDFGNAGIIGNGRIAHTADVEPITEEPTTLGEIAVRDADSHYYLDDDKKEKFGYLRGSKKIPRQKPDGTWYDYSEGAMSPYDDLGLPGRTMLTSEGSVNRSTHIIKDPSTGELRILTPVECERLNMFPDNWTDSGMPEKRRYFMMGNALVCGIISRLGVRIEEIIDGE